MARGLRGTGNGGKYRRVEGPENENRDLAAERLEWFFRGRRDAKGEILKGVYAKALRQRWEAQRTQIARDFPGVPPGGPGSVNWTPIGPSVIAAGGAVAGRITTLVIGPSGNRVYAGADNGGVWFSADGGTNWAPLDDYVVSPSGAIHIFADALSVGSIALKFGATAATDEIYVGTGGYEYSGIGVRHSTAGGAPGSWTLEGTNLGDTRISAITIDPDNASVVLAGTDKGLFKRPTAGSMATWNQVTSAAFTNPNGQVTALIVAGSGGNKTYYAAFSQDAVYSSPDGATWTKLSGVAAGSQNIALAAGESDPSAVYAYGWSFDFVNKIQTGALYRLVSGTFQTVAGTPSADILFPLFQGSFDLVVAVDPSNGKTVYLMAENVSGDLALFKGTLSGGPGTYNFGFTNAANPAADATYVGSGIHPDGHALAFGLNALGTAHDPTNVWVGCDGGVYRSTMSGSNGSFKPRNTGLAIAQMTYLAQRVDTDAVVLAGTQDNGTVRFLGEQAFVEPIGGDGGGVAIDPNNPYRMMRQYIHASLESSADGGFGWTGLNFPPITANTPAQTSAAQAESKATDFYTVIATTPPAVAPTLAAFGTNRLWITSDPPGPPAPIWGNSWVTLPTGSNPYSLATPNATQDVIDGQPITAIAIASATLIFAATYQSIWRYDKVGANWSRTVINTSTLPAWRYIAALVVDNAAAGSFYASMASGNLPHLYYFDGANWTPAMPTAVVDAPAFGVALDPSNVNTVYVGTDVGCYQGVRTGPTSWNWNLFSQGLPEASIQDLKVHDRARLLRAATHGRGLWEISLTGAATPSPDIYLRVNYGDTGRINGGARNPWVEGLPDPTRQGFKVYHWMSADVKVRRGSLPGLPVLMSSPPDYLDYAVNIGDYVDSTTDIETADVGGTNRLFVEVHNRSVTTPVPAAQVQVLLLLTDAAAGLPAMPANYASHINGGDTNPAWLAGTPWRFADTISPYRTLPRDLDVRTPQVVEYDIDFSTALILPAGHDHVCAAAFVTSPSDPITATNSSLDVATMQDKHIAHRNLHLVAAGATPVAPGSDQFRHEPQSVLLDFHNPRDRELLADIVFEREAFPGHISVLLPKLPELANSKVLEGFKMVVHESGAISELKSMLGETFEYVGELLERLGEAIEQHKGISDTEPEEQTISPQDARVLRKMAALDRTRLYVAEGVSTPTFKGIRIPAGGFITAALTLQAPARAVPGNRFAFHVIQRHAGQIIGGSSYIFAVTAAAGRRVKRPLVRVAAAAQGEPGSKKVRP